MNKSLFSVVQKIISRHANYTKPKTIKKTVDELFRKMQKYSPFIEVNFFMN